MEYRI